MWGWIGISSCRHDIPWRHINKWLRLFRYISLYRKHRNNSISKSPPSQGRCQYWPRNRRRPRRVQDGGVPSPSTPKFSPRRWNMKEGGVPVPRRSVRIKWTDERRAGWHKAKIRYIRIDEARSLNAWPASIEEDTSGGRDGLKATRKKYIRID